MDREAALGLLSSSSPHERLKAARFFRKSKSPGDLRELKAALRRETVAWVRKALEDAIQQCSKGTASSISASRGSDEVSDELRRNIQTKVTEEVTATLLHEIEPVVGLIRAAAEAEVPNYQVTTLHGHLSHLTNVLSALRSLREAATAPRSEDFDLSSLVKSIAKKEAPQDGIDTRVYGPEPALCLGDPQLLSLAVTNGIRNAVDAVRSSELNGPKPSILITWGVTDIDYWIAIVDNGPGLTLPVDTAFKVGKSTKKGHPGMGLTIARQAMTSLGGEITLTSATGNTKFEVRWYR